MHYSLVSAWVLLLDLSALPRHVLTPVFPSEYMMLPPQ